VLTLLISIQQSAVDPAGFRQSTFSTALGEHKSVEMRDGSSMQLNTRTLASVEMDTRSRTVTIHHGEALLKIAADPRRFVLHIGGAIDLKTTEAVWAHVRLDADGALRVDMLEGEAWMQPAGMARIADVTAEGGAAGETDATSRGLGASNAFQPLRVRAGSSFSLHADVRIVEQFDPSEMTRKLAWTRGQIVLAGEALRDAVAEFNRYNSRQLVIGDESIANLTTGGTFYATEPDTFTRSLNKLFGIHAVRMAANSTADVKDVVMLVGDSYSGL
jgi:transmembrane sensor